MNWHETPVIFDCKGDRLIGIATQPENPADTGVLIVVGGPQYRAGSHRQFTLIARRWATEGYASLRFDYRGMGDSEGSQRNFEHIEDDIASGCRTLIDKFPKLNKLVIWGLCDAASAALIYASQNPRVSGLILLNPWVHTESAEARARLKNYYLLRLWNPAFWSKLLTGKINIQETLGSLYKNFRLALKSTIQATARGSSTLAASDGGAFIGKMLKGLQSFSGDTMFILSGNDLTAQEFIDLSKNNPDWRKILGSSRIVSRTLNEANHTFAKHEWRSEVSKWSSEWILKHQSTTQEPK